MTVGLIRGFQARRARNGAVVHLLLVLGIAFLWSGYLRADPITAQSIVKRLAPKPKTRSLDSGLPAADGAFLAQITKTTRGLGRDQRDQLHNVATAHEFPALDLVIMFDIDSFALKPEATEILTQLGDALRSDDLAKLSFIVAGHTDARGTFDYNQKLSEMRARQVKDFLMRKQHIDARRLLPVGYGQEHLKNPADPLADENRRVQIVTLPSQ
jgi:outer membrane protein OmpA-like peptidoglycan-associated protein